MNMLLDDLFLGGHGMSAPFPSLYLPHFESELINQNFSYFCFTLSRNFFVRVCSSF